MPGGSGGNRPKHYESACDRPRPDEGRLGRELLTDSKHVRAPPEKPIVKVRAFRLDLRKQRLEFGIWRRLRDVFHRPVQNLSILRVAQDLLTLPQEFQGALVPCRTELQQIPQLLDADSQRMRPLREVHTGGVMNGLNNLVRALSHARGQDAVLTGNLHRHQGWQLEERQGVHLADECSPRRGPLAQQMSAAQGGACRCRWHAALEVRQKFQRDIDVPDTPECAGNAADDLRCFLEVRLGALASDEVQRRTDPSRRDPGVVDGFGSTIADYRHQRDQALCIVSKKGS